MKAEGEEGRSGAVQVASVLNLFAVPVKYSCKRRVSKCVLGLIFLFAFVVY